MHQTLRNDDFQVDRPIRGKISLTTCCLSLKRSLLRSQSATVGSVIESCSIRTGFPGLLCGRDEVRTARHGVVDSVGGQVFKLQNLELRE